MRREPVVIDPTYYESDMGRVLVGQAGRLVFTAGTFDIFHYGHLRFLSHCRRIAGPTGLVIVSVNSDQFIHEFKGEFPVNSYHARASVVAGIAGVDAVIQNTSGKDLKPVAAEGLILDVKALRHNPRFIVIGTDWATRDYYTQTRLNDQWLDEHRITLCYVPYTQGISSSKLRRHIVD